MVGYKTARARIARHQVLLIAAKVQPWRRRVLTKYVGRPYACAPPAPSGRTTGTCNEESLLAVTGSRSMLGQYDQIRRLEIPLLAVDKNSQISLQNIQQWCGQRSIRDAAGRRPSGAPA